MRTVQRSFAQKYPSGKYRNFYSSLVQMRMCGDDTNYEVQIVADENGDYYTWHEFEDDRFHFTNSHRPGVVICFPYGPEVDEKLGRGKIIRCRIVFVREVPSSERTTGLKD